MSQDFDFGLYQKKMEKINGENKDNIEPKISPPKPASKPKTITRTKTITEIKVPTLIQIEKLLTQFRNESPTTKFLYNRIMSGGKPDRATIQKLLDFLRFCNEKNEL